MHVTLKTKEFDARSLEIPLSLKTIAILMSSFRLASVETFRGLAQQRGLAHRI